jgi:hypothetical protein
MAQSVDVSEEMILQGVQVFMDYELGGMTCGEAVKKIYVAMLSASRSNRGCDTQIPVLGEQSALVSLV